MLSRWLKQEPLLIRQHAANADGTATRFRLRSATDSPGRHPAAEQQVFHWIQQIRTEQFESVTYADIQAQMRALTDQRCKASAHWLYNFMRRFHLSRRKATTTHCISTHDNTNVHDKLQAFREYLEQHPCDAVWNMDQTPVWINAQQYDHTVERRGAKCARRCFS
jgi:hypothetical protein